MAVGLDCTECRRSKTSNSANHMQNKLSITTMSLPAQSSSIHLSNSSSQPSSSSSTHLNRTPVINTDVVTMQNNQSNITNDSQQSFIIAQPDSFVNPLLTSLLPCWTAPYRGFDISSVSRQPLTFGPNPLYPNIVNSATLPSYAFPNATIMNSQLAAIPSSSLHMGWPGTVHHLPSVPIIPTNLLLSTANQPPISNRSTSNKTHSNSTSDANVSVSTSLSNSVGEDSAPSSVNANGPHAHSGTVHCDKENPSAFSFAALSNALPNVCGVPLTWGVNPVVTVPLQPQILMEMWPLVGISNIPCSSSPYFNVLKAPTGVVPNENSPLRFTYATPTDTSVGQISKWIPFNTGDKARDERLTRLRIASMSPQTTLQFPLSLSKARFFVIKSFNEEDVHRSIKYEIWCSTERGNHILNDVYCETQSNHGHVYLLFSVNGSGHFCGACEMISVVDTRKRSNVWSRDKWQGEFKVQWLFVKDVPNQVLRHIRLENNEDKPVTNCRDCTEILPVSKGMQVMKLLVEYQSSLSLLDDFDHYEKLESSFSKLPNEPISSR